MCWMAAIPLALSGGQMLGQGLSDAKAKAAAIDASRKQKLELIKQMNYRDLSLQLEQKDTYDQAVTDLTTGNLNSIRNMGTIRTAIAESGLEGNSINRIQRQAEADAIRESAGIKQNYTRDYNQLLAKRYENYESTKSQVDAIKEPKRATLLGTILPMAGQLGGGIASGIAGGSFSGPAFGGALGSLGGLFGTGAATETSKTVSASAAKRIMAK